jgi:heme/copper-type cytochrome/quinol oxidase subunit 2
MSPMARWGALAALIVVAVVGFVIAKSGGSDNTEKTKTETTASGKKIVVVPVTHIVVRDAKPVGGPKEIDVKKGDPVRFDVTSDVADEIHVHGYDFHKDVKKGGKVAFDFPAKIDGEFDVELESRSEQIASLKVEP